MIPAGANPKPGTDFVHRNTTVLMDNLQQNDNVKSSESATPDLWVLEGQMDLPVVLPRPDTGPNQDKAVRGFAIDFSCGDGDGFVELRASDVARANASSWWSKDQPVLFEFRCSVVAADPFIAFGCALMTSLSRFSTALPFSPWHSGHTRNSVSLYTTRRNW